MAKIKNASLVNQPARLCSYVDTLNAQEFLKNHIERRSKVWKLQLYQLFPELPRRVATLFALIIMDPTQVFIVYTMHQATISDKVSPLRGTHVTKTTIMHLTNDKTR